MAMSTSELFAAGNITIYGKQASFFAVIPSTAGDLAVLNIDGSYVLCPVQEVIAEGTFEPVVPAQAAVENPDAPPPTTAAAPPVTSVVPNQPDATVPVENPVPPAADVVPPVAPDDEAAEGSASAGNPNPPGV